MELNKKEILEKALEDWINNKENTLDGFCKYFNRELNIEFEDTEYEFPELYSKRSIIGGPPWTEHYWFRTREERIDALKKCLLELSS